MRDGGVSGINLKLQNLMTNMNIVKSFFICAPF